MKKLLLGSKIIVITLKPWLARRHATLMFSQMNYRYLFLKWQGVFALIASQLPSIE